MGNIFTRTAALPKAVLLFALVAVSGIAALAIGGGRAAADGIIGPSPYGTPSAFIVRLDGSQNPSQYSVTATRQSDKKVLKFTFGKVQQSDPNEFYSESFAWGNGGGCINTGTGPQNTSLAFSWIFNVAINGKSAGTKSENYCGTDATSMSVLVTIPVTDGQSTSVGGVAGTLAYTAPDGTDQPFRSNSVATLTGPGGATTLKVDDNGHYTVTGLPVGTYNLAASYNATKFDHGELQDGPPYTINSTVVVTVNTTANGSFTVNAVGNTIQGAKLAAACPNGATQDSTGACNADKDTFNCGSGSFNWFVCPVLQLALKATQQLDNFIMSTLDIDVKSIFDNVSDKTTAAYGYYTAWNSFRVIAIALLVIGSLIMVASQALGFEFLDAYTMRKVLPRLFIAIIGISLSWPLMRYVVSFFDVAGFDVRALIYAPFEKVAGNVSFTAGVLSTIGAVAAVWALGFTSLTLIVTIISAVFVGFLILLLREIVLVLLIIIAPIAIACYILPNTQKVWNLWRDNFLGLLLMFPIMSGLIAAAHAFAIISIKKNSASISAHASGPVAHITGHNFAQMLNFAADSLGGWAGQAIGIAIWFYVYFLLPAVAKASIGTISTIIGRAGDPLNGLSNWGKKKRRDQLGGRFKAAQNNQLTAGNNRVTRGINSVASAVTDPYNNAAYYGRKIPGFKKRGLQVQGQIEHARLEQSRKLLDELNHTYNDKAYRALNGGLHGTLKDDNGFSKATKQKLAAVDLLGKAPKSVGQLKQMAHILGDSDDQAERLAGNAIEGSMGRLATLYQDPEMGKASLEAAGLMGLSAHGFLNRSDISSGLGSVQNVGGTEFAQAVGTQAQLLGARSRPDLKAGYGINYNKDTGKFEDGLRLKNDLRGMEMLATLDPGALAGAKGGFYKKLSDGGSGDILSDVLKYGSTSTNSNDPVVQKRVADNLKLYNDYQQATAGKSKDDIKAYKAQLGTTAGGIETLKVAEATRHYDSVLKVLSQNSGQYSHASIDVQNESARILREAGTQPLQNGNGGAAYAMGGNTPPAPAPAPGGGNPPPPPPGSLPPMGGGTNP